MHINSTVEVLHPYYKLAYIGMSWGGPKEQAAEIDAGNPHAKDWQDEARKVVEKMVRCLFHLHKITMLTMCKLDGPILQHSAHCYSCSKRHWNPGCR
jgi:hypothetical protein